MIFRYFKLTLHYLNRNRAKLRKNLLVFLFFLAVSTSIWLIQALRKNYVYTFAFPVKYINFPQDKLHVGELPPYFFMLIKASGYTLIQYQIKPPATPMQIDISAFRPSRVRESSSRYFLLTKWITENLQSQVPSDIQILRISPDTLYFQFDKVYKKKVPVVPAVKIEFREQYSFMDIPAVEPDCVYVYGPREIIDTLTFVKTESVFYRNVSKSIQKRIDLQKQYSLTYAVQHVVLNAPVEKFTEAAITIPIEKKNVPDSLLMKVIPEYISLTCRVGLSNYEKIKPYYFKATVDYKATRDKVSKKLKVRLEEFPRMISQVRYQPQRVDYIIKRKN